MQKLISWFREHSLTLATLFLLAFIPLYPKLPLIDVKHTWVYVRVEDFVVLFVLFCWALNLGRKNISLKTPLTIPIFLFWIIGLVATLHSILLVVPYLGDTYPNVAFLSFLRRIEYMSLFFVAYSSLTDKKQLPLVVTVLSGTALVVALYGLGQKYLGFPAFLTMNEEFAKGVPLRLSELSRISSTFGGHYDLAAYLVLIVPILVSMVFGLRNFLVRLILLLITLLGLIVMFMTVSRVSLFALFLALGLVIFIQKKKLVIVALPLVLLLALVVVGVSPRIVNRFVSTLTETNVLVDASTGEAIGHTQNVPNTYFADKVVKQTFAKNIKQIYAYASPSAALIIPYLQLAPEVVLFREPNAPTGEDLPQGTGYVNLTLAPVVAKLDHFYFEPIPKVATSAAEIFTINGSFLIKKAVAYDLSFTTRFQGEWPRAMAAFKKNILVGSGYGSVGLAVDNSYLRMLAEVGLLGFGAFLAILVMAWLYIRKTLPAVDSPQVRSFLIGFGAGVVGLSVNALFIDVFEASKVAFVLWILFGISLGLLRLYERRLPNLSYELKAIITSWRAVVVYFFILAVVLYSAMLRHNFVGDDFTWFRWVADCGTDLAPYQQCQLNTSTIIRYFTQADGFFYRPGTKLYFLIMYSIFWLNQNIYHAVSLILHFLVSVLVFFLARKILKHFWLSVLAGATFLLLTGQSETVFWISATGFLFTAVFSLASLFSYIAWEESKKALHFVLTLSFFILSLLFHELGIVTPFFYLLYAYSRNGGTGLRKFVDGIYHKLLLAPLPVYLAIRYLANSHWLSGDYNYSLAKLPFNVFGNAVGYVVLTILGPSVIPVITVLRLWLREQVLIAAGVVIVLGVIFIAVVKKFQRALPQEEQTIVLFGTGFFLISLLPFLALGNMTSRYSYLASVGVVILLIYLLHKLYTFLVSNGRTIALLSTVIVAGIFALFQLVQHQQVRQDWSIAADKSKNFIVTMQGAYEDYWATEAMEFHFVNVPIRQGEAWVFPVGIPDALWLIFRNPAVKVYTWPSIELALNAVDYGAKTQKVFVFEANGKVKEVKKPPPNIQ